MGTIWLVRHGQSAANAQEVIQGPRIDAPLSDLGVKQANAVGLALSASPLTAVFSSPLVRARDTAGAIARHHELPVQSVGNLHEVDYGDFVGKTYGSVKAAMDAVTQTWARGAVDVPYPGGESAAQAQERIRAFADGLLLAARGQEVAVVAHGRINKVLLATLTLSGLHTQDQYPQSNACINELEVVGGRAVLKRLNDVRHLPEATHSFS